MAKFEMTPGPEVPVWAFHRICTSCSWCEMEGPRDQNPVCTAFIDIVTGRPVRIPCREVRGSWSLPDNVVRFRYLVCKPQLQTVGCGPEGKLWERKEKTDVAADHKG